MATVVIRMLQGALLLCVPWLLCQAQTLNRPATNDLLRRIEQLRKFTGNQSQYLQNQPNRNPPQSSYLTSTPSTYNGNLSTWLSSVGNGPEWQRGWNSTTHPSPSSTYNQVWPTRDPLQVPMMLERNQQKLQQLLQNSDNWNRTNEYRKDDYRNRQNGSGFTLLHPLQSIASLFGYSSNSTDDRNQNYRNSSNQYGNNYGNNYSSQYDRNNSNSYNNYGRNDNNNSYNNSNYTSHTDDISNQYNQSNYDKMYQDSSREQQNRNHEQNYGRNQGRNQHGYKDNNQDHPHIYHHNRSQYSKQSGNNNEEMKEYNQNRNDDRYRGRINNEERNRRPYDLEYQSTEQYVRDSSSDYSTPSSYSSSYSSSPVTYLNPSTYVSSSSPYSRGSSSSTTYSPNPFRSGKSNEINYANAVTGYVEDRYNSQSTQSSPRNSGNNYESTNMRYNSGEHYGDHSNNNINYSQQQNTYDNNGNRKDRDQYDRGEMLKRVSQNDLGQRGTNQNYQTYQQKNVNRYESRT